MIGVINHFQVRHRLNPQLDNLNNWSLYLSQREIVLNWVIYYFWIDIKESLNRMILPRGLLKETMTYLWLKNMRKVTIDATSRLSWDIMTSWFLINWRWETTLWRCISIGRRKENVVGWFNWLIFDSIQTSYLIF